MEDNDSKELCRLCGKDRVHRPKRKTLEKNDFRDIIKKVVGIDVQEDDIWLPKFVCRICVLKLQREKKIIDKKKGGVPCVWVIPNFQRPANRTPFQDFLDKISVFAKKNGFVSCCTQDRGMFVKLHPKEGDVLLKVEVLDDQTWKVQYRGKYVPKSNPLFADADEKVTVQSADSFFKNIADADTCLGNADFPLIMSKMKKDVLLSYDQKTVTGYKHGDTLRAITCPLLAPTNITGRCEHCEVFRSNLYAKRSNLKRKSANTMTSPSTAFDKLETPEKKSRFLTMSKRISSLKKKVQRQKVKIQELIDSDGVETTEEQHSFLSNVTESFQSEIQATWSEDSPQRLLWEEQVKRSKVKSAKGMRWHPLMIKWCISLHCSSPKAYRQVAESGFLKLPSVSTLKSYMNFTTPCPGINTEVISFIVKEICLESLKDHQKKVSLVWDEMKIKSGIVTSVSTGRLVGFCEQGQFNEELKNLSSALSNNDTEPEVASHILVFMVRGIMASFSLPFMWYPCCGFSSEHLWEAVWKATRVLEDLGLQVHAWVCDGASPNRRFFRIHRYVGGQYKGNTFYTTNRYDKSRKIFFICDPPHLLKTTRNNLENSHGHSNTKSLVYRGQSIKWPHIVSTVREDKTRQLSRLPRLKEEHIHLSPQLRMRVRLAAQVLSSSMANALEARDDPEFIGTAHFCRKMDKWFDCLNGRFLYQDVRTRKPELAPYRQRNDWRFQWLTEEFLGWLDSWEDEVMNLPDLSKTEKNELILSYQTLEGLRITTKSFVELVPQLLAPDGSLFLLAEKLNQDRLEMLFGKVRRSLGDSDNPTVSEASHRLLTLLIAGSTTAMPKNMNCTNFDGGPGFQLKRTNKL